MIEALHQRIEFSNTQRNTHVWNQVQELCISFNAGQVLVWLTLYPPQLAADRRICHLLALLHIKLHASAYTRTRHCPGQLMKGWDGHKSRVKRPRIRHLVINSKLQFQDGDELDHHCYPLKSEQDRQQDLGKQEPLPEAWNCSFDTFEKPTTTCQPHDSSPAMTSSDGRRKFRNLSLHLLYSSLSGHI